MKNIRIGIFGLGRGGSFYKSITACGGEVVALCDSNDEKRTQAKKHCPQAVCYTDFNEFINHPMDAVLLANYFTQHAEYAVICLEKNIHVLSECTSNVTMADGVRLARAAEKSKAIYMLAENYPFMKFNQEIKRICDGGTLGKIMYAEGEYNHPVDFYDEETCLALHTTEDHWRNYLPRAYYITHSLAPIMHATGSRPIRVSAMPVFAPLPTDCCFSRYVGDAAAIITCLNDDDSVFKVTGCAAFGAHSNSYRVCGSKGQIENLRGMGDKVMLRYNSWHIPEGMQEINLYEPEWQSEDAVQAEKAGHGGGDYFVVKKFFECIRNGEKPDFDVYFATKMASVAILAHRSLIQGGTPYDVPDFSIEEDRQKYENDTLSPFRGAHGEEPSYPCCSHPDYAPSDKQKENFRKLIEKKK